MNQLTLLLLPFKQGVEVFQDANKLDLYGSLARESSLLMVWRWVSCFSQCVMNIQRNSRIVMTMDVYQMGGSDFHGIDPKMERAPGGIPFPRKYIDVFLEHAKRVWEQPLVSKLQSLADEVRANGRQEPSEKLLIWCEQEEFARQTVADLGLEIQVSRDAEVDAPDRPGDGHYRTIRVA